MRLHAGAGDTAVAGGEGVTASGTLAERSCRCEGSATRQPWPRLLRLRLAMTIRVAGRQDLLRPNQNQYGIWRERRARRSAVRRWRGSLAPTPAPRRRWRYGP